MKKGMIRGGGIWVTSGCNWEPSGQSRCERPKEDRDGSRLNDILLDGLEKQGSVIAHLIRVKDKGSDIAMSFVFNTADNFWCGDASDNDVSLLLKFDDKREAQWMITT